MATEKVIGIDLGTTNSCVAIVEDGTPVVIPNRGGYKTTPSMVAIAENGKRLVGHIAKRQAITNAENTVFAAKRLEYTSPAKTWALRVGAPMLPPLMVGRMANKARRSQSLLRTFTKALPPLSALVAARVAGEWVGYLTGADGLDTGSERG